MLPDNRNKSQRFGSNHSIKNMVIVGFNNRSLELWSNISRCRHPRLKIIGFVDIEQYSCIESQRSQPFESSKMFLGETGSLQKIISNNVIDGVIMALPIKSCYDEIKRVVCICEEAGIPYYFPRGAFGDRVARNIAVRINNIPLIGFCTGPAYDWKQKIKRAFDLILGCLMLVLLAALMLTIGIVVRLTSKGPALFKQTRVGLNGRLFTMFKFRTMFLDAENQKASLEHLNEISGPVFKIRKDPRVTRVGRILRHFSLDELPQLLNVVRGDMSIVGPRPPIPEEVDKYDWWERRRLSVRPGITCIWQVNGRSHVDFENWMKMDLQYIDNWSFWLDFKIILKTLPAVLKGSGAY